MARSLYVCLTKPVRYPAAIQAARFPFPIARRARFAHGSIRAEEDAAGEGREDRVKTYEVLSAIFVVFR